MKLTHRVAVVGATCLVALGMSTAALAKAPPPKRAQCADWANLVGTSGPFASESACTTYVDGGGKTYPKTPTFSLSVSGPENGLGALVANPQARTAGSFTDPALRVSLTGSKWVPKSALTITYTAGAPLSYSYGNPTTYFTPGVPTSSNGGGFSAWFQDNCFDGANHLVSGDVPITVTATDTFGQSATATGTLHCDLIPATVVDVVSGPEAGLGPLAGTQAMRFDVAGWHWAADHDVSLTYVADPPLDYTYTDPTMYFTAGPVHTDSAGSFTGFFQDNCYDLAGALVTVPVAYTVTATDGTSTATASGTLDCSQLAP